MVANFAFNNNQVNRNEIIDNALSAYKNRDNSNIGNKLLLGVAGISIILSVISFISLVKPATYTIVTEETNVEVVETPTSAPAVETPVQTNQYATQSLKDITAEYAQQMVVVTTGETKEQYQWLIEAIGYMPDSFWTTMANEYGKVSSSDRLEQGKEILGKLQMTNEFEMVNPAVVFAATSAAQIKDGSFSMEQIVEFNN